MTEHYSLGGIDNPEDYQPTTDEGEADRYAGMGIPAGKIDRINRLVETMGMSIKRAESMVLGEAISDDAQPATNRGGHAGGFHAAKADGSVVLRRPERVTDPGNSISTLSSAQKATRDSVPTYAERVARGEIVEDYGQGDPMPPETQAWLEELKEKERIRKLGINE